MNDQELKSKTPLELLADIESFIVDKVDDLNLAHNECKNTKSYVHKVFHFDALEAALKDYERRLELAKEYKDVNNVAKRLLALEIIKEKQVNVHSFIQRKPKTFEEYQNIDDEIEQLSEVSLSKEEFDLLKEVLL